QIPGVVENGLFLDMCDMLLTGHLDGTVEVRNIDGGTMAGEGDEDNVFLEAKD
ncbi:MAG: ribose 5-phosphate isomerase A, partial [Pseudomonadota bacterium]